MVAVKSRFAEAEREAVLHSVTRAWLDAIVIWTMSGRSGAEGMGVEASSIEWRCQAG